MGDRLLPLDRGLRVAAGQQQLGERLRVAGGSRRERAGVRRVQQRLEPLVDDGAGEPGRGAEGGQVEAAVVARAGRDARVGLAAVRASRRP